MKQKFLFLLFLLIGVAQSVCAQEPYAVLSEDNTTLTFYYDDQKESRGGMSVGPFEYKVDYNSQEVNSGWFEKRDIITTVNFDASFANCTSITSTAYWFFYCENITTITNIGNLKTDNVTDMRRMFTGCSNLTSLDVSGFKTDNVTDMNSLFYGCRKLTSLDVSGFNTENVTSMAGMFDGCSSLTNLDVSGFKTDNVTYMNNMFSGCSSLTSLDVSGFKTDNVPSMKRMFWGCSSLTSLDLSAFNTENVKNMQEMFSGCSSLTSLDLSAFNTEIVWGMKSMFGGCSSLTTIYVDETKWSTAKVTDSDYMFYNCTKIVGGNGTVYDENYVTADYARIDKEGQPGYFTAKASSGIQKITQDKDIDCTAPIYKLNGVRLTTPQKGINIIGGRKVVVK